MADNEVIEITLPPNATPGMKLVLRQYNFEGFVPVGAKGGDKVRLQISRNAQGAVNLGN